MLHDSFIRSRAAVPGERRGAPRHPSGAELVVLWHHDPTTAVRYRVLDLTEDGARLLATTPLVEGMSGTAISVLPAGRKLGRACVVRWSRQLVEGGYEAGVKFL